MGVFPRGVQTNYSCFYGFVKSISGHQTQSVII